MTLRFYIFLPFIFLLAQPLLSQPVIEQVLQLSFKEGLSHREVRHIIQDSKGFMWIATANGLNRYTDRGFEVFDNNTYSKFQLHENSIHHICEIAGDKLVLLNDLKKQSVEILDLKTFESKVVNLYFGQGIKGIMKAVYAEPKGEILLLTENAGHFSVFQMNDDFSFFEAFTFSFPNKKGSGNVRFIKTREGDFWIMDDENGIVFHSPSNEATLHFGLDKIHQLTSPSDAPYFPSILYEDLNGRVWVAFPSRKGLLQILPGSNQLVQAAGFPQSELYCKIFEDNKGNLLVGTFLSFGKLEHLTLLDKNGHHADAQWILDIDNKINHIHSNDFAKNLFIGTHVGIYIVKMKEQPIRWVLAEKALPDEEWENGISIRGITGDGQGNLYIARELKAWYKLHLPTMQLEQIAVNDANGKPIRLWCNSNVVYDQAGLLWGGSCDDVRGGLLLRLDLKTGITKSFLAANKEVGHIVQLENRTLVLASGADDAEGQLLFFDPDKELLTQYADANGSNPFANRKPQFIHVAGDGSLWIGTNGGLIRIDGTNRVSKLYSRDNGNLTNDNIIAIHEAEDGRLMLGTSGGLNILDVQTGDVENYNLEQGLSNNTVCGILPDGAGNYFISTYYGLSYFDSYTKLFTNFYLEKGLSFNEFNRLAYHKDENGNYYFGTLNGINIFKKEDLLEIADTVFPLQWTKVTKVSNAGEQQIWDRDFSNLEKIVMRQGDDFMRFEFNIPYYALPKQNRYAVRLEGYDTHWRLLKNTSFVEINRPPPGQYKLRVKASPARGEWMDKELTLELLVKQAIYQRPWFQITLPLVILLLSYLISLWYIKRIKRQEEEQTRINKKFAELELQALQAQMNPHFIFNALSAIQYFIQKNNVESADNFLGKFAKLMRLFLESSKNKYITLSEEIKLLSLYVELEQMRFSDKFEVQITVDDELDVHTRDLPSILIQPFVENAINHGLFHKKGKGHLSIDFAENEQGVLTCLIQDDGVGRVKANLLKEQSQSTHKSRGMQIVRERLEVLQQVDEISIIVNIYDLNPDIEDTGTVVRVEIPDSN